eukprot:446255-Ditylum_brightwellii.AAC.1
MTAGANLPFERTHLEKYCPHERNKTCLVTQWLITSQATFYEIKNDNCMISHLDKYQIYMNLTNVQAKQSQVLGFFVFSHGTYSNRKAAHNKLTKRLCMSGFDLHNHHCRHDYRHSTQACITKGKLYCLNNLSKAEREKWPHTGHW